MTTTFNIAPRWVADTKELGWGTLPTANNSSVGSDLVAWKDFQNLLYKSVAKGKLFNTDIVSTYSLVYTNPGIAYQGGILAPNGDIHFVPYLAPVGQKISVSGTVSTYSLP